MAERNLGRPWTEEEDQLLTQAVAIHGDVDKWKTIALAVRGRSNKACRKRWLHSLSPSVKKTAWTAAEDAQLKHFYSIFGPKWSAIARQIPGRTDDACSKRYRESLDPSLKKEDWTPEEDEELMRMYNQLGGKWCQVGQALKRSSLGCRNRWRLMQRRRAAVSSNRFLASPSVTCSDPRAHSPDPAFIPYRPPDALQPPPPVEDVSSSPDHPPPSPLPVIEQDLALSPIPDLPPFLFSSSSLSDALTCSPSTSKLNTDITDLAPPKPSLFQSGPDFTHLSDACDFTDTSYQLCGSQQTPPAIYVDCTDDGLEPLMDISQDCNDPGFEPLIDISHTFTDVAWDHLILPDLDVDSPISTSTTSTVSPITPQQFLSPSIHDQIPLGAATDRLAELFLTESLDPTPTELYSPIDLPHFTALPALDDLANVSLFYPMDDDFRDSIEPCTKVSPPSNGLTSSPQIASPRMELSNQGLPNTTTRGPPRGRKRATNPTVQPNCRLSSNLTVTSDPTILPYACGHDECWPAEATSSSSCFATSKELTDHYRDMHADSPSARPFRCGLAGCSKSWKSVNGLQYHLQISTAHFQHAVTTTLTKNTPDSPRLTTDDFEDPHSTLDRPKRSYRCEHPNCCKVYRQLSGLRYHQIHGHPNDLPAQLEVMPPTLARQIAIKTGKKKRKRGESPSFVDE